MSVSEDHSYPTSEESFIFVHFLFYEFVCDETVSHAKSNSHYTWLYILCEESQ